MTDLRTLTLPEIETLLDWAAAEGWNPGLADAAAFHEADPTGFFGAFVDGRMAAGIATVAYGDSFGFLGLYICHPDFRGRGLGRAVWDAGTAYLGHRTIGLDGVPAQQANYAHMGFVPAYGTTRWSGNAAGLAATLAVHRATVDDRATIAALDRAHFPAPRHDFLDQWLGPPHDAWVIPDRAYAVCRPCRSGNKIGPIFARTTEEALALIAAAARPVQIDIPDAQTGLTTALAHAGFVPSFSTMRMYRGAGPALPMDRIFAVTSLELG